MSLDTDQFLLERFVRYDCEASLRSLIERHGSLVYGVARRMLPNDAEAHDAAQATFIALALKASRLNARQGLGGWLHRVARQIALDQLKASRRRVEREGESERRAALRRHEERPDLDAAIAALPDRLRRVVIGHYFEGESLQRLAQREGCSPSAISMRLTRARERLRQRGALLLPLAAIPALSSMASAQILRVSLNAAHGLAGSVASPLIIQAQEALRTLFFTRLKWAATLSLIGMAGVGFLGSHPSVVAALSGEPPRLVPSETSVAQEEPEAASSAALIPELHRAVRELSAFNFKPIMERQSTPIDQIVDAKGQTALHWAARYGRSDHALLLIRRGADVNATDAGGRTPLFEAISSGDGWLQRELILAGADLNHAALDGETPLTHAIRQSRADEVELLLWSGAKIELDRPLTQQPATLAQAQKNREIPEIIEFYKRVGSGVIQRPVPNFVKNSLHEAARTADYARLESYLRNGAPINLTDDKGRTPLRLAVMAPQEEVVFYLLSLGADPNIADQAGRTPLMSAMYWQGGSFDAVRRFLILKETNPFHTRADGFSELTWAIERDNPHGVQWLLWLGANGRGTTPRGTPFQIAFQAGRQGIMDLLKRNGIEEPIRLSKDPVWNLHNGIRRGDQALVEEMLAAGVDIDTPDAEGHSPLVMAIATKNLHLTPLLIERGADLNFQNEKNGVTPLYMTMIWDYQEMHDFRLELLEAGADPDVPTRKGETPLMRAVWKHPTTGLQQLVEHGVDLNARDQNGLTALGRALRDGHTFTAKYLRKAGAKE